MAEKRGKAKFKQGDVVRIPDGIVGTVRTAKPSPKSGWWYEVVVKDNMTWTVNEDAVEKEDVDG